MKKKYKTEKTKAMDIHAKKSMDDTKLRQPFIKKQKNLSKRKIVMKRRQNPWTLNSLLVNLQ